MRSLPLLFALVLSIGSISGITFAERQAPQSLKQHRLLFDSRGFTLPISIPDSLRRSPHARTAAELVQEAITQASGQRIRRVHVGHSFAHPSIMFELRASNPEDLGTGVGYEIGRDIVIWANLASDIPAAASWFLEQEMKARWFVPGSDGFEVVQSSRLSLPLGKSSKAASFISRTFTLPTGAARWAQTNRMARVLPHGHTAADLVTKTDMQRTPALAPLFNGRRLIPRAEHDQTLQPDLSSPETVAHVVKRLSAQLSTPSRPRAVSFGQNDTWRWDQSDATLEAVAPARYFRQYPVYSDLLFGFLNQVASKLERDFPDRLITTYAYQWTEQVPRATVHRNVVPFLTADRSQWFDEAYKREDQDLVRRWMQSGASIVGTYDYYYGAPYLVPRPTLYAIADSIPFLHQAGVRAFYAEANPNWGIDGPKLWLAAQLLWDASQNPTALLEEYYARYWKEAAAPMRRFFEICDRQYLTQPGPAYWIKFFKDDHQRVLFPPAVRRELFECLDEAERLAVEPVVKRRLAMTRAAWEVADAFCVHDERRDELSRVLHDQNSSAQAIRAAADAFTAARQNLVKLHAHVRRAHPHAITADLIGDYLRNDPRPHALRRLASLGHTSNPAPDLQKNVLSGQAPSPRQWTEPGTEILGDQRLATIVQKNAHPFIALDWNERSGPWLVKGEPFETRRIELTDLSDGSRGLRYAGVNQESALQTVQAVPGALYRATVRVRGKISPGNMSFLLLFFSDKTGKPLDLGHVDRLPIGEWSDWTSLELTVRAPKNAFWLTFSMRATYQVNDDYVEFAAPSLRLIP